MSKKIAIISFLVILIITGCFTATFFYNQYKKSSEWLINEAENSFKYEAFLMTKELEQIYLKLMDANTAEKFNYALGRIDAFLANDPYHEIHRILNPDNISEKWADDILAPDLRMPIRNFIYNSRKHLKAISEIEDFDKLREMNVKFYEITNSLKELDFGSINSLTDENVVNDYLKKLENLNNILTQDL